MHRDEACGISLMEGSLVLATLPEQSARKGALPIRWDRAMALDPNKLPVGTNLDLIWHSWSNLVPVEYWPALGEAGHPRVVRR